MECNVTRQAVRVNETVFDSAAEIPLQTDITLPDYCPDIVKILKCSLESCVRNITPMGKKLRFEGIANVQILYLGQDDSQNEMHLSCAKTKIPFTKEIDLKREVRDVFVFFSQQSSYCSCRAVSRRRLELRAALNAQISAIASQEAQVITDVPEEEEHPQGIQLRRRLFSQNGFVTQARQMIDIHEELALPKDKEPIRNILFSRVYATLGDRKMISGKIVTKGELHVEILYTADGKGEENINRMEYTLPISGVVDAPGTDDSCTCCVGYEVCEYTLTPKADPDGENTQLELTAQVAAQAQVCCQSQIAVADDCYSTRYQCEGHSRPMGFLSLVKAIDEKSMYKSEIELPDGVENILNVWATVEGCSVRTEEKGKGKRTVLHADIALSVLAGDKDGGYQFYDSTQGFDYTLPMKNHEIDNKRVLGPKVEVTALDYNRSDRLGVRCELKISACICELANYSAMEQITVDEEKPIEREDSCALTIYYADPGENLWEIAKRYHTGMQSVLEANESLEPSQEESIQQRQMLLIPISAK